MNQEVKGNLAKLLATEDLIVEHKNVDTASFNVQTRILTLPIWGKASNTVYDLLVGHEVGHALYTPDVDWQNNYDIPHDFVNIVEDVRIEKMMKRRYAGLNKTFYKGYQELHEMDFFKLKGEDISKLNLADKVIVYSKIGGFFPISFSEEEKDILKLIEKTETFDEVLEAAKILYDYCSLEKECDNSSDGEDEPKEEKMKYDGFGDDTSENEGNPEINPDSNVSFGSISKKILEYIEETENSEKKSQGSSDSLSNSQSDNKKDENRSQSHGQSSPKNSEVSSKISESLNNSIKDLVDKSYTDSIYIEVPKLNLDTVIIPYQKIVNVVQKHFKKLLNIDCYYRNDLDKFIAQYTEFKKNAQKEVNYLIKEFECKKSADAYARASISRTGILDCAKLHTYKYNEDLFKKITTIQDGKNHGLIFILDWSGSMSSCILDTIKQLYNLIWFCKKSSIPFEVYAFTNDWKEYDKNGRVLGYKNHCEPKRGEIYVDHSFNLMNFFSSKMTNQELEIQLTNLFVVCSAIQSEYYWHTFCPEQMVMSGTPLNESLIALHEIIPKFKSENRLQKVHCVVLTDGDGFPLRVYDEYKGNNGPYIGMKYACSYNKVSYLRDRKLGTTYTLNYNNYTQTSVMVQNLRDKFPEVSFVGIRIISRDVRHFLRQYYPQAEKDPECNKLIAFWKKNRSFSLYNAGYNVYFGLSGSVLSTDSDFEVDESASKGQIKSAFVKSLRSKKMNKKILSEFISLVA